MVGEEKTIETLEAELLKVKQERDIAVSMLAEWCCAIDRNGTGWDDWDEFYKDAAYRDNPIRGLLDQEIERVKKYYEKVD